MNEHVGHVGPAFPARVMLNASVDPSSPIYAEGLHPGMSLRDYFAAHAPHAVVTSSEADLSRRAADHATWAYLYADAMIATRKKP